MYEHGIDLVVVSYRTPGDLAAFLGSLEAHRPTVPWSVTVVNVDPLADDKAVAVEWVERHPQAAGIAFDHNVGYARACNRGAQLGRREVVAFFNADVRLTPNALDECYWALKSDPAWGILGPRQVDDDGRLTAAGIVGTNEAPRHRGWHERDVGQFRDVRDDVVTVAGSAYFVRRDVWDRLRHDPLYQEVSGGAEGAMLPTPHY